MTTYTIHIEPDGSQFKATVEGLDIIVYGGTQLEAAEAADIAIDKARMQAQKEKSTRKQKVA